MILQVGFPPISSRKLLLVWIRFVKEVISDSNPLSDSYGLGDK